ncbi:MAG: polysaccharide lyase family 7 protein [Porticoccaceae bacterium]|nr:polysaccharide lyase family 7 protein [Porticoccaceae bacterium]
MSGLCSLLRLASVSGLFALSVFAEVIAAVDAEEQTILNPGFESGWANWVDGDPSGTGTAISDNANSGSKSAKLSEKSSYVAQVVQVNPNTSYQLTASVRGTGNLGVKVGSEIFFEQQDSKTSDWRQLSVNFSSADQRAITIFGGFAGREVRFDDFALAVVSDDGQAADSSIKFLSSSSGGYGLSPDLTPGQNFDLADWYLNTPDDADGNGISDRFSESDLAKGFTDPRYFYTGPDGGLVMRSTIDGAKTSKNTRFARTELREMLRRGNRSIKTKLDDGSPNKNNWVFSSAPKRSQLAAGGVDGTLKATLAVNHVTTSGTSSQVGRVVIGQIHAAKDEPIRLYYRKLPGHTRGSVYAAHEVSRGDDIYVDLIGSRSKSAKDPADGIALNEKFSYVIEAQGHQLSIRIIQNKKIRAEYSFDLTDSGYDVAKDYMYFKAGVYNQNNSGDPQDFVQATFYKLENKHRGYQ